MVTQPILIWGAGAVGGTLGATFIRAGHEVVLVDTDVAHVETINTQGLRIQGPVIDDRIKAKAVLPEALEGKFERSFLCVRAEDSEVAVRALVEHLLSDGYVVSAQDGLNESVISRMAGDHRVIGCLLNFSAARRKPGVIDYARPGAVVVGELGGKFSDRIETIYALMVPLEPQTLVTSNIWGFLWSKLIRSTLLLGAALGDENVSLVLADPVSRVVLRKLALEVATIAAVNNVQPEPFDGFDPACFGPLATQEQNDLGFAEVAAATMLPTLGGQIQRPEAAQLLPVIDIGQSLRIPTPLVARLIEMAEELAAGQRRAGPDNLHELARAAP